MFGYVAEQRVVVIERVDGTTHLAGSATTSLSDLLMAQLDAHTFLLPLEIRGKAVGVVQLSGRGAIRWDRERARFAAVLSYYAALAVERVRLTAEEERAEALAETDRLKDALLASVSHDLRTPLTTIKALARELRSAGDERLVVIEEEADRLNRMVGDLLDLSRIRADALALNLDINTAEELVGAALDRVSALPGAPAIQARINETNGVMVGRFDFVHALRALANLLENALRHGEGKPVELHARRRGDRLCFEVLDRGPGVPFAETERIFEPFHALGADRGAGLGLAISRQIAEAQGGAVTYQPREGGGSVFSLELPAVDLLNLNLTDA
jgi:two-component system sensor histidine kinase KdpD